MQHNEHIKDRRIRVFLVDDQPVVWEGIRAYAQRTSDITVIGVTTEGVVGHERILKSVADVFILNIGPDVVDSFDTLQQLRRSTTNCKIIGYSVHEGIETVRQTIKRGALGYVSKRSPLDTLNTAIHKVAGGITFVDPCIESNGVILDQSLSFCLTHGGSMPNHDLLKPTLTVQEMRIVSLIVEGLTLKEIGCKLDVRYSTMTSHIKNIHRKLEVHTRGAVVAKALKDRLL
jgi:DNA-binding NarL/FixJ family response regulator